MSIYLPNPMRYSRYMNGEYGMQQPQSPIAEAINTYTRAKLSGPTAAQTAAEQAEAGLRNEQARGEKMKNDGLSQFGNMIGDLLKQQPGETPDQHSQRLAVGVSQFAPIIGPQAVKALQDGLATANAYGGPDAMRRALVLQGHDPGVNFAGTRQEADSVAARNNTNTQNREIAVKGAPSGASRNTPVTPALAAQMDQMVDHIAPGMDPTTKALVLSNAATAYQNSPNAVSAIQGAIQGAGTVKPAVHNFIMPDEPAQFVPNSTALPSAAPVAPPKPLALPSAAPAAPADNAPATPVVTGTPQEGAPAASGFTVPPINQRKQGGVYATPNGYHTWTGTGWVPSPQPDGSVM